MSREDYIDSVHIHPWENKNVIMKRIDNNSKEIDSDYINQEVQEKYPNMIYNAKLMLTQQIGRAHV